MMPIRHTFRPQVDISTVLPWGKSSKKDHAPEQAPEDEVEPTGDGDSLRKAGKPASNNNDSDHETESATSSDKDTAAASLPSSSSASSGSGVASSFARAGKLLWGSNPLSGFAALKKQHSRTVSDFSESDFSPFTPGTPVWTRYGLGTIFMTRPDDGFLIVHLQGQSRMTLFLNSADEDYYSVPAIRHDWVETPAGEGRVVSFDAKTQMYNVRIGNDSKGRVDVNVNVHRNDLRRIMPTRRQTHVAMVPPSPAPPAQAAAPPAPPTAAAAAAAPHHPAAHGESSVIAKGFNSALQFVTKYYYNGQCVVTTFGSGTVIALDQTNHRAQVQLTWGATAFLSTDAILHYTKALVGMEVTTKFGSGVVTEVRAVDGMYAVKLTGAGAVGAASQDSSDEPPQVVYVHESDLTRGGGGGRRLRLGSAQKQVKESTTRLFSFATSKVKLFSQGSGVKNTGAAAPAHATAPAASTMQAQMSPTPAPAVLPPGSVPVTTPPPMDRSPEPSLASRSKSTRVIEDDAAADDKEKDKDNHDEPSSAGI